MIDISLHGGPFGGGGVPLEAKPFMEDPKVPVVRWLPSINMYYPGDGLIFNPVLGLMTSGVKPSLTGPQIVDVSTGQMANLAHPSNLSGNTVDIVGIRSTGELIVRYLDYIELYSMNKVTGALTYIRRFDMNAAGYSGTTRAHYSVKGDMIIVERRIAGNTTRVTALKGDCTGSLWSVILTGSNIPAIGAVFFDGDIHIAGQIYTQSKLFLVSLNAATGAVTKTFTEYAVNVAGSYAVDYLIKNMTVALIDTDLVIITGEVSDLSYGISSTIINFTTRTLKVATSNYSRSMISGYDTNNFYVYQVGTIFDVGVSMVSRATMAPTTSGYRLPVPWINYNAKPTEWSDADLCRNQVGFEYKQMVAWSPRTTQTNPTPGYGVVGVIKRGK